MRCVAIYNVWDDWEILRYSLKNVTPLVEGVIIIGSNRSNFGEISPVPSWVVDMPTFFLREPQYPSARESETDKRNYGLLKAKQLGYTHFLTIDADEFYEPEPFLKAKELFHVKPNLNGLVCNCQTYFKNPTLTIGLDITLVPFIHKLNPDIKHEFNRKYPFAWIDGQIRIDPTRSMNISSGVERIDLIMHHMSYVRPDLERKIRNSTANANLERSSIREDLRLAKDGYFCKFYQRHLTTVSNQFGIPDYGEHLDETLQPGTKSLETTRETHKP